MRGLRSTLALLVVLIGLGAYIYFVVFQQDDAAPDVDRVFESFDPASIEELTLTSESGETTTVRKSDESWQIIAPVNAAASDYEVSAVTTGLEQLELVRVVDENPSSLDPYGLSTPRMEIAFTGGDPPQSERLRVGAKTPTGANAYALRGDEPQVFMIPAFQEAALNKSSFDLRDRSLAQFERDQVTGVTVTLEDGTFSMAKQEDEWTLTRPTAARADFGTVEGLVGRIDTVQVASVVTEESAPEDLRQYGLDAPRATVTLEGADATVMIGSPSSDGAVFAKDASRPAVFTVDSSVAVDLMRGPNEYRRRDLFGFRAFNTTRIEFTRDGQTWTFERVKGEGDDPQDVWRRTAPDPADVDRTKMEALLAGLAGLRAEDFVDSTAGTGLDHPLLSVFASFEEGTKEERVIFGREGTETYASRADDPGAALVETERLDESLQQLEELTQ